MRAVDTRLVTAHCRSPAFIRASSMDAAAKRRVSEAASLGEAT